MILLFMVFCILWMLCEMGLPKVHFFSYLEFKMGVSCEFGSCQGLKSSRRQFSKTLSSTLVYILI